MVRRRAWIVLASIAVAMVAAFGVTQLIVPRYEATATMFVGPSASTSDASVDVQYASLAQALVTSYARLAQTRAVVDTAARSLDLPRGELAGHFETGVEEGVQVLTITADAKSGSRAAANANALAAALADSVTQLSGPSGRHIGIEQVDRAAASASPASPVLSLNLLFGGVAGLLVGLALASGLERLDQRIRTAAEAEEALGLPVVGVVPRFARRLTKLDAMTRHANPQIAEPFGKLAIALANSTERNRQRTLLLTSVDPGDGKTTVAAHLALSLVDHRRPTALIEADLRQPTLGRQFPSQRIPSQGAGPRDPGDSLPAGMRVLPNLNVHTAVKAVEDPGKWLQSNDFRQLLELARGRCDLVLLDAPPALSTSDVSILAQYADAVVLVVRAEETRADDCREVVVALKRLGTEVAGVVVTHARPSRRAGYYGSGRPALIAPEPELKAVGNP